jgi:hypothetical protein
MLTGRARQLLCLIRRAEILAATDGARAQIARGEGIEITEESMHALAEDIKQRGRARFAAENH